MDVFLLDLKSISDEKPIFILAGNKDNINIASFG
jgi:hypothetical protein